MVEELELQAAFSVLSDKPIVYKYNDYLLVFIDGVPFSDSIILYYGGTNTEIFEYLIHNLWKKINYETTKNCIGILNKAFFGVPCMRDALINIINEFYEKTDY